MSINALSSESSSSWRSSLVDRVREHDRDAWQKLVRVFGPLVFHWCRSYGLQASDAADATQEVFQSVAVNIHKFRGNQGDASFRSWLWMIARNRIRDFYRSRDRQIQAAGGSTALGRMAAIPDDEPESFSSVGSRSASESPHFQAAMLIRAEFQEQTWAAFEQIVIDGRNVADVAADLGISPNAARIAKCRVLKRLREEFGRIL